MNNEEKILALLAEMRQEQQQMRADMNQIQANQDKMQADMGEMRADMGEMQKTLTRVALTRENVVLPKLQLLAEGHDTLLKTVIKAMSQRIENLEKAQ